MSTNTMSGDDWLNHLRNKYGNNGNNGNTSSDPGGSSTNTGGSSSKDDMSGDEWLDHLRGKYGSGSGTKSQYDRVDEFNRGVDAFNQTMGLWGKWYDSASAGLDGVGWADAGREAANKNESVNIWMNRIGQQRDWANEHKDLLGDNYDAVMQQLDGAMDSTYWMNRAYLNTAEYFSQWDSQEAYDQAFAPTEQEVIMGKDVGQMETDLAAMRQAYDDLDEILVYREAGYGTVPEAEREQKKAWHDRRYQEILDAYGIDGNVSKWDLMARISELEDEIGETSDAQEGIRAQNAEANRLAGYYMMYSGMDYSQLKQAMETVTDPQEKAWLQSYAGTKMTAADYETEIGKVDEQLGLLENYIKVLRARSEELAEPEFVALQYGSEEDRKKYDTLMRELGAVQDQLISAENEYDALKSQMWQLEHDARFRTLRENDDFDDYSGYVVSITDDQGNVESTVDDPVYRYINSRGGELFPFIREGHKKEDYDWIEKNVAKYSKYTLMTDAEIEEMNYLYRTQGKQAASDYISWLSPTLDARAMGDLQESMAEMTANAPGWANALSVPLALSGGIGYLDIATQNVAKKLTGSYQPINYNSTNMIPAIAARTVTETTAAMITDEYGVIDLDPEYHPYLAPILNGKGLADVYQLGMSAINSRVAALTGNPVLATMLLASSAATNGVLDALERGATDDQALTMGLLNGVAEYLFEKFEIEQLLGQDSSIVKAMLNQGLTEAFGEGMTSVANTIADAVIMADKSEYQTNVRKYIDEGLSPEEAKQKAFADIVIQVGWDAVGGFIMGAPGGASVSAINNVRQNQARAAMDKAITGYDVGQISKATSGRLAELGETENVELLAGALAKQVAGQKLTKAEKAAIKASTYGQQVAGELDPGRIRAGDKSSEWAESIGTIRTNAAEYSKRTKVDTTKDAARMLGIADSFVKKVHGMAKDQNESTFATEFVMAYEMVKTGASKETLLEDQHLKNLTPEQRDVIFEAAKTEVEEYDTEYAYADDGKTSYQGKEVEVEGIAKAGKGKLTLKLSDGQTVDAADVVFGSDNDAVFYETMARMGVNTEDARKLAQGYAAAENKEEYTGAVASAYRYGRQGVSFESVPGGKVYRSVSEDIRKKAHEMGMNAGRKSAANAQKRVGKKKPGSIKHYKNTTTERNGVHYDDVTADLSKLNAQQTEGVRLAEFLAKAGLDVHVFQSEMVDGKFTTDNGMYYSEDGSIHIDLNAGNRGQGTMAYTIAHEVTHFVRAWSPAKFRVYAEAVLEATGKTGADVSFRMDQKLLEIKKNPDYKDMTLRQQEDIAYEEVIAELSETMFTDTDVAQRIADRIREKDMGLFEKLKEFFRDLADRLRRAYSGLKPDSAIAREGRQALRTVEALRDAFAEAFVDAAESYRNASEQSYDTGYADMTNEECFGDSKAAVLNQIRPPYSDGSKAFDAFADGLDADARKTFDLFYGFYQRSRITNALSVTGKRVKAVNISSLYLMAQDWNDMLAKEPKWAAAAQELADFLPADIRKRMNMNEDGTLNPTPLELEFKMPSSMAQRLVDALPYEIIDGEYTLGDKTITLPKGKARQSVGGEAYRRALIAETRMLYEQGKLKPVSIGAMSKDRWGSLGFLAANGKTGASGDFTTVCPQMMFNRGCWYCYRRAAMEKGVNNKLVAQNVWYTGEILRIKQKDIDALNENGGLRIQSFGDWMPHFSTMLADVLYDAEQRGLQVKIITKEPSMISYIAALREQGIGNNLYFNLSADYTIERGPGRNPSGPDSLDAVNPERPFMRYDNSYWWKRAMAVEEAAKYREKYPWVNTRIVATDVEEFIRGLKDPAVDVVTGYHGNKREFERVDSTTGEHKVQVEALGDSGMPRFAFNPATGQWFTEYGGKTATHKRLADAIAENGLQWEYYIKTCCITGRCATCKGKCGALARDFNVKNATNRDSESVEYWRQQMQYAVEPEFGDMTVEDDNDTNHVLYQIRGDIVDVNGKEYGSVVELEYKEFNKVRRSGGAYIDFIRNNLIKKRITVLDGNGGLEVIEFAREKERVHKDGANNDHSVIGELLSAKNDIKRLVILNAVETTAISRISGSNNDHSHQWLDENGWQIRTSYVMTKDEIIYPVTLKIARARDGRNILYDVHVEMDEGVAADKTATSLRAKKQAGQAVGTTTPSNRVNIQPPGSKSKPQNRKNRKNVDAKKTLKSTRYSDSAYMDAVEAGNMERAQRYVAQAAKEAGYPTQMLFHGTGEFGFTSYNMGRNTPSKGMIYGTDRQEVAANYGKEKTDYAGVRSIGKKLMAGSSTIAVIHNAENVLGRKYHVATEAERRAAAQEVIDKAFTIADELDAVYDGLKYLPNFSVENYDNYYDSPANAYDMVCNLIWTATGEYDLNEDGTWNDDAYDELTRAVAGFEKYYPIFREYLSDNYDAIKGTPAEAVYDLFATHKIFDVAVEIMYKLNSVVKDGAEILTDGKSFTSKDAVADAVERIKDSGSYRLYGDPGNNVLVVDAEKKDWLTLKVPEIDDKYHSTDYVAKWARDNGYSSVYVKNVYDGGIMANEYIFFDANQVKSADPVTYDDDGNVIPLSERFNAENNDIRYSKRTPVEKQNAALLAENVQLKEDVVRLKELVKLQGQVTGGTKFTYTSVEAAAKILMRDAGAKGDAKELTKLLNEFYAYIAKGDDLTWESVREAALPAAEWLADNVVVAKERDPFYDEVLRDIRGSKFYLDETQKAEAAHIYGSYNDYRKNLFGTVTISDKSNMSLDSWWHEMSGLYPSVFATDVSASDMPGELLVIVSNLREEHDAYHYDRDTAAWEMIRQVYDSYWNVSTLKTVADVKQKQIDRLKGEHIRQMAEIRKKHKATVDALKKQHSEEVKAVRKELRADADRKVADIKKRNADSRKRAAEKRNEAMLRGKIQNTVKKLESLLVNETKKRNVKEGMKDLVETAIASADILWMNAGTDVDLVRNGIGTPLSERESQLLNETMDILAELDGLSNSPENRERLTTLRGKLSRNLRSLGDVLERERKRLNAATVSQALDALAKAYFEMGKSDDKYIRDVFQQGRYEYLTQLSSDIEGTLARDMTVDQLQEVLFAYETVLHAVRNANKMFSENIKQTRRELGEAMITEILNSGPEVSERSKAWIAANRFIWNNTKSVWATERIGSKTFEQLMSEIFKGQYLWATDMAEAQKFQQECAAKHGANSWDLEAETPFHSSTGREFKLTLDQIMSIYAYARREQAHDHLLRGGIVFPRSTETTVEKHGIKRTMLKRSARAYGLSMDIIEEIIGELKPEQIAYVNEMQKYLSETMGNKGNEVSRKMYGIPLFREKNYFPLMSAGEYMDRKREADFKKEQGQVSIANMGFTKPVVPKANNPVVLDGFTKVWSGHVNEMCLYHGLALPMEDYRRATGYATPNIEESDSLSVNSAIETIHGKEAVDYFDQLYRDLNGGAISDNRATFVARSTSKFKKAAVMLSNSVWVQQFSAIGRAGLLIDPKYFSNFAGKIDRQRVKKNWEQLKKYAPVAIIKDMGGFDTGMGRGASEFLMAKEYRDVNGWLKGLAKDKNHRDEVLGFMPAWSDRVTWCAIWDACKRETAQKYDIPVNSEAFLKKAGERFCEVVEKTQVYDSTLAKSANMRSKDTGMVALTAFMAEPTTTINMIEAAIRSKDGKRIGRTLGAAAASILLNNLLASIVYAMRDDDEEETIIEKYTQAFISGMLDDINPLTYYPILKDIWSLLQGYDIERTDMAIWSDLTDSVKQAVSMLTKDTDDMSDEELAEHQKKVWDSMLGVLMYGANAFGVPLKNVVRDTKSYFNTVKTLSRGLGNNWRSWFDSAADAVIDSIPIVGLFGKESKQNRLFDAVRSGDEEYLGRMEGQYSSEKAAENALKKEVKAQYADGKLTVEEASEMLMSYNGMTAKEALKQVLEWDFEAEYGFSYGDLKEQYQAGKISWEDAMEARITVGGERADKAGDTLDEWDFEADHGWAYEDRKTLYLKGDISKAQLVAALTGYGGMTQEEVDKYISEVEFEGEYGFSWADRKYAYAEGSVPESVLRGLLVDQHGYTEDKADRYMVAYNWIRDNQRTDLDVDDVVAYTKILDDIDISIEGVGIDVDDYMAWKADISQFSADYDSEGKSIPYSKINKAFPYIDSLDLTAEQKTALAIASGWAYSTVMGNKLW